MQFAKLLGKPSILVVGGYDVANMPEIGYGHQRGGLKTWVSRRTMRLATSIVTNSDYSRKEISRNIGLTNGSVTRIFHGVPDQFGEVALAKERMALTVGNVNRSNLQRKGHEPFVRAAALLPDVKFVLVGAWQDDAIDYLRSIAAPNVKFTGRVADNALLDYYRKASVYVQPSRHEGFGMSVAESMLAGCVPVTTAAGALPEVTGDCGIRMNSVGPDELAQAIRTALDYSDDERRRCRTRILDRFPLWRRAAALKEVILPRIQPQAQAQSLAPQPFVSVLMPVRNEAAYIGRSLGAVLAQSYSSEQLEVIVADGISTDNTREIVAEFVCGHNNLRLVENSGKIVATGLNAALRVAKGDIIIRVDGHTAIDGDYVRECVAFLQKSGADNVGGRMSAVSETWFGRAVAVATSSRFGVGGARFHYSDREEWVDTVYLGAWRREVFDRIGTFDEEMVRNQDDEFNYRLRASGGRILLSPKIKSEYYNRATLRALWRQYFQYGYWKVRVLQKHPRQMQLRQFVPPLFAAALVLLLVSSFFLPIARILLVSLVLTYAILSIAGSLFAVRRTSWILLPLAPIAFSIIHVAYGLGFIAGLVRFQNRWRSRQMLTIQDERPSQRVGSS
jgi:glycosyltransferase involved in cell wall biosynthesis